MDTPKLETENQKNAAMKFFAGTVRDAFDAEHVVVVVMDKDRNRLGMASSDPKDAIARLVVAVNVALHHATEGGLSLHMRDKSGEYLVVPLKKVSDFLSEALADEPKAQ